MPEMPPLPFVQAAVLRLAASLAQHDPTTARCQLQALEWSLASRGHDTVWLQSLLRRLEARQTGTEGAPSPALSLDCRHGRRVGWLAEDGSGTSCIG